MNITERKDETEHTDLVPDRIIHHPMADTYGLIQARRHEHGCPVIDVLMMSGEHAGETIPLDACIVAAHWNLVACTPPTR